MLKIGVQTQNVICDQNPMEGFGLLRRVGFSGVDFSLNAYQAGEKRFFDQSIQALEAYFTPHRRAAQAAGIAISQMHMLYPVYVPTGSSSQNDYRWQVAAPKNLELCAFFDCPYIVLHGFKLAYYLGSEEAEWTHTEQFLNFLAPMAKEMGITMCIENLYESVGGHLVEGPCCDVRKAAERIDRMNDKFGAEVLGFCFDTGHANLSGLDMEAFLTALGHRLKVLHIHDNDGREDLHQLPFTFTKTRENKPSTDWEGFVRGLCNIQFDGTLSFETAPVLTAFPAELKEEVLRFIAKIGLYFKGEVERASSPQTF